MPATRLKQYLEENLVRYTCIPHCVTYTAQETAAMTHIRGRELAKAVMVKVDGEMAMAVVPATKKVDPELLKEETGADRVELSTEREFKDMFPDCEVGAMPPFGNLYGLRTFVDSALAEDEHIGFNAGTHAEAILLDYSDYWRLVQPVVADIAYRARAHA